ncbi:hypothetical protein BV898_16827 [Hypsibius exemplaris]|uniref:Uncharacterized protein n=1 Tax=Hypsibius exemplaris TaxID=2072580 RepID=A0A9X6RM07_HYPEX|nr:hypothetical protein BV898_16827 [Hypsibius exemplaris]
MQQLPEHWTAPDYLQYRSQVHKIARSLTKINDCDTPSGRAEAVKAFLSEYSQTDSSAGLHWIRRRMDNKIGGSGLLDDLKQYLSTMRNSGQLNDLEKYVRTMRNSGRQHDLKKYVRMRRDSGPLDDLEQYVRMMRDSGGLDDMEQFLRMMRDLGGLNNLETYLSTIRDSCPSDDLSRQDRKMEDKMLPDALIQVLTKLCDIYLDLVLLICIVSFNFAAYVWYEFPNNNRTIPAAIKTERDLLIREMNCIFEHLGRVLELLYPWGFRPAGVLLIDNRLLSPIDAIHEWANFKDDQYEDRLIRDFKATVLTSKEHKGKAIFDRDVLTTSSEKSACDPEQQKNIAHDVC